MISGNVRPLVKALFSVHFHLPSRPLKSMLFVTCRRCRKSFDASSGHPLKKCPLCGAPVFLPESSRRNTERVEIRKGCVLFKGGLGLDATAVDISPAGAGVVLKERQSFEPDEEIRLVIEELDIDTTARVVWSDVGSEKGSTAGLVFSP